MAIHACTPGPNNRGEYPQGCQDLQATPVCAKVLSARSLHARGFLRRTSSGPNDTTPAMDSWLGSISSAQMTAPSSPFNPSFARGRTHAAGGRRACQQAQAGAPGVPDTCAGARACARGSARSPPPPRRPQAITAPNTLACGNLALSRRCPPPPPPFPGPRRRLRTRRARAAPARTRLLSPRPGASPRRPRRRPR